MTDPRSQQRDQDAEPTMTTFPEDRPDAGASAAHGDGRGDSPDVVDTDDAEENGPD
jgi:hypothetical protein